MRELRKKHNPAGPGSLAFAEWPPADQAAWQEACRPGHRFQQGGTASHLAAVSQIDIGRRYGMFLDFLERAGMLNRGAPVAAHTTPENVAKYIEELQARVRSVTVWNCTYKLRRASQLMARGIDFGWLSEIEKDVAFTMQIGTTFREIAGVWWITLPSRTTKSRTPYERQVPSLIKPVIDKYIDHYRPFLLRADQPTDSLWPSATTGQPMRANNISTLVSKITHETIGVSVSPHLFRTAGASTAAVYGGSMPCLASALLDQRDPIVTEEHYNRASSMSAALAYASLIDALRERK